MIEAQISSASAIQGIRGTGDSVREQILLEMKLITYDGMREIVTNRLHGGNPLFSRSGNLARATERGTSTKETSTGIIGIVGTDRTAPYGAVHEYGGTFTIPAHISHSAKGKEFIVKAHTATFPERSYLRSWLRDNVDEIRERLDRAAGRGVNV